ncbi:MAG: hypothetical protein FJZ56_07195 [Chlamydiae bacterium]|nr:hypothetical protein [Chlamydiota bacterium]
MSSVKADRNDPCPCGSGKKYKKAACSSQVCKNIKLLSSRVQVAPY